MRNEGVCQKAFSLTCRPPKTFKGRLRRHRTPSPIFQPYLEALPLESGYYSFVIDEEGRFRVIRGNTSSHAGMNDGNWVGAAGHFWITRAGKVGMVYCGSSDHWLYFPGERDPTVRFVIDAFRRHQAFDLSEHVYFKFLKGVAESFTVNADGSLCLNVTERRRMAEAEGQGEETGRTFAGNQIDAFFQYSPNRPPCLHHIKQDQSGFMIDYDDRAGFEVGPSLPPYRPADKPLTSGRKAFILDEEGWLVVGSGHHLLSGGNPVGAAGQLIVDKESIIQEVSLNFSGHYRPTLSADYARYTYRALHSHPLLTLARRCRISGRKDFDINGALDLLSFQAGELLSDDSVLEDRLDRPIKDWGEEEDEGDGLIWR